MDTRPPTRRSGEDRSRTQISMRVALVATLSLLSGVTVGILTQLAQGDDPNAALAVLAGLGSVAGAYTFFDRPIH